MVDAYTVKIRSQYDAALSTDNLRGKTGRPKFSLPSPARDFPLAKHAWEDSQIPKQPTAAK